MYTKSSIKKKFELKWVEQKIFSAEIGLNKRGFFFHSLQNKFPLSHHSVEVYAMYSYLFS